MLYLIILTDFVHIENIYFCLRKYYQYDNILFMKVRSSDEFKVYRMFDESYHV